MTATTAEFTTRHQPRLGLSHCLAGAPVRYDGGHRRDTWISEVLARHVVLYPVCPEAEAGLGTPREPMHLHRGAHGRLRLLGNESGTDHTAVLAAFVGRRVPELAAIGLDGYILKARSPSCGLSVAVHGGAAQPGLFAAALMKALPDVPVVEESQLHDACGRETFCIRLFARTRLRALFTGRWTARELSEFHAREKMLLLSCNRVLYDRLGRLVAGAQDRPRDEVACAYSAGFLAALAGPGAVGNHVDVLQHLAGHFRERLDRPRRAMVHDAIERYRAGSLERSRVLALMRELAEGPDLEWVRMQTYLAPCPEELLTP